MQTVKVERTKTIILSITLGFNVSSFEFLCEMRENEDPASARIATWDMTFATDGKDGELLAVLDNSITTDLVQDTAWLFLYRVSGITHLSVFEEPLEVEIFDPALV